MLVRFAYLAVTHVFAALPATADADREKDIEILALRHQLTVLHRQLGDQRPQPRPEDRAFLAALLVPLPRATLRQLWLLVSPDTVLRWHRDLAQHRHARASSAPMRIRDCDRARSPSSLAAPISRSAHCQPAAESDGRRSVAAHKHILADHGGPDAFSATMWTVFATRGAEQRVKRLLAIPGHPDLNHADKHLGIRKAVVAHQIQQLEHAVGAPLLDDPPGEDSSGSRPPASNSRRVAIEARVRAETCVDPQSPRKRQATSC